MKRKKLTHLTEEIKRHAIQVCLLEKGTNGNLYKATSGGILGSQLYFDDIAKGCNNSEELAARLNNKSWDEFEVK